MPKIVRNAIAVECQSLLLLIMYLLDLWRSARDRHPVGPFSLIEWDLVKATITKYLLVWSTYPPDLGGVHISTWFEMIDESKPDGWRKAKIDVSYKRFKCFCSVFWQNVRLIHVQIWQYPKVANPKWCYPKVANPNMAISESCKSKMVLSESCKSKYGNIRKLQIQIWQYPRVANPKWCYLKVANQKRFWQRSCSSWRREGGICRWGSPAQRLQLKGANEWTSRQGGNEMGKRKQKQARSQGGGLPSATD